MNTLKPISTVSYNTQDFLIAKLNKLVQEHVISFYAFVPHIAEPADEYGVAETKNHIHLFVRPERKVNTDSLRDELTEYQCDGSKPLGTIWWEFSKFGDWYLYSIHDDGYLAYKGESRKYHYSFDDVVTSDKEILLQYIHQSDMSRYRKVIEFKRHVESGMPFAELVANGFVPYEKIHAYEKVYHLLKERERAYKEVERGIRPCNHEGGFVVNEETGEAWFDDDLIVNESVKGNRT